MTHRRTAIAITAAVLLILTAAPLVSLSLNHRDEPFTATSPAPPNPSPPPATSPRSRPMLFLAADTWVSWHVIDVRDGTESHGGAVDQSITASVIKVGIAADFLAGLEYEARRDPTPREHDLLVRMIRNSDNAAASQLYRARGGRAVITRLTATCGMTHTTAASTWGATRTTTADLAALGTCVAAGNVASAGWVAWLLDQMRHVEGVGRFGIAQSRPTDRGRPLAYKNGWLLEDGLWHVNCLAIADWWTLAVMVRYPAKLGLEYGADVCSQLAAAAPDDETAPATAV